MEKRGMNVLFIVTNGELEMTRHDTVLLVVASCVSRKFEDLGSEVFEDGGKVD